MGEVAETGDAVEEIDPCTGVRCIKLYKPCPEGYIDVSECCPNTGDCALDPDYVIPSVGLVQMQPIAQPVRSSTPLPFERTTTAPTSPTTSTTSTTSTTETPASEEPKESGLGILALGLIALEVLAT